MSSRDIEYEKNNVGYDYQYPKEDGGGIKCKNYEICGTILPKWWFEAKGEYICTNCHMLYGTWGEDHVGKGVLEIHESAECPICLETKRCVSQPRCSHVLCIECFKRCWSLTEDAEKGPEFLVLKKQPQHAIFSQSNDNTF